MHEHENLRRKHGAPVARHGDELGDLVPAAPDAGLRLELGVHVEDVARSLHLREAQALHRRVRLVVPAAAQIPARRFGARVDEAADDDGRDHGRAQHEAPVEPNDVRRVRHSVEGQVRGVAKHNAKRRPHLPLHHKRAANGRRRRLRCVDGHRGRLGPNGETEREARNEHVPPAVRQRLPDDRQRRDAARHEDGAAPAEEVVERHRQPAADESATHVRGRID